MLRIAVPIAAVVQQHPQSPQRPLHQQLPASSPRLKTEKQLSCCFVGMALGLPLLIGDEEEPFYGSESAHTLVCSAVNAASK